MELELRIAMSEVRPRKNNFAAVPQADACLLNLKNIFEAFSLTYTTNKFLSEMLKI
jgi:hypothetical protein